MVGRDKIEEIGDDENIFIPLGTPLIDPSVLSRCSRGVERSGLFGQHSLVIVVVFPLFGLVTPDHSYTNANGVLDRGDLNRYGGDTEI